jgi:hypothetical protein
MSIDYFHCIYPPIPFPTTYPVLPVPTPINSDFVEERETWRFC